jgi:DNA-binding transcriptional regulator YiaG
LTNLLGSEFKDWRLANNVSQTGLSKLLGIHRGTLSKYETGALTVPQEVVESFKKLNSPKKTSSKDIKIKKPLAEEKFSSNDLVTWRKDRSLSRKQVGDILECSSRTVGDYETAVIRMPSDIEEKLLSYDKNPFFEDQTLEVPVSEGRLEIIKRYGELVKENSVRPVSSDFTASEMNKIKYHFRNMRNLHNAMNEELDLSGHLFETGDIFTPERIKALEDIVSKHDRFFITTAVSYKKVNEKFLAAIRNYCNRNDAALIVMLSMDVASTNKEIDLNIDPSLDDEGIHILQQESKINQNLFLSDIKVSAKQINPLTGLRRICQKQQSSAIFASPKQALEFIAISADHYRQPYALMTTGAITDAQYDNDLYMSKRTSYIAEKDHVLGGVIVERVNKKKFHFRQVQADVESGEFIDLGFKYDADGDIDEVRSVLVMGDYHAGATDKKVKKATNEMCEELSIVDIVLHDFFDGYSISHHDRNIIGKMARKSDLALHVLENEFNYGAKEIEELQSWIPGKLIMVKSNHDEFLDRYLDNGAFFKDHVNYHISLDLHHKMLDMDEREDILSYAYRTYGSASYDPDRIVWLERDQSYTVGYIELGAHGDLGANGSRGSLLSLENAHGPCVVGHTHSAAILRTVFRVGTSSKLNLDYNRGPSSWTHTHCLVYPNGSRQLINIIDGDWKL